MADTHAVELSVCCRAPFAVCEKYRATETSPSESWPRCMACGAWCDTAEFIRNDYDGTLTDPETGETGLTETPARDHE